MLDMASHCPNLPRHANVRVNFLIFEAANIAAKKAQVIFRIESTHTDPIAENVVLKRHAPTIYAHWRILDHRFNLFAQYRLQNLVGVYLEDPFVPALRDGPVLLFG